MTVSEKVAYLKGLADGLGIKDSTNEGKLMLAVIDVLEAMADDIEAVDEQEYEVTCPKCGETITVYEEDLDFGSIRCPKCDAELEFDMSPDDKDK